MRPIIALFLLIGNLYGQCTTDSLSVLLGGHTKIVHSVQLDSIPCMDGCDRVQNRGAWVDVPDVSGYFAVHFTDTTDVRMQLFIDCHLIAWDSCFQITVDQAAGVDLFRYALYRDFPSGSSVRIVTAVDSFGIEFKATTGIFIPVAPFMDTDTLCPPVWVDAPAYVHEVWIDLHGHEYTRPPVGQLVYGLHSKRKIFAQ